MINFAKTLIKYIIRIPASLSYSFQSKMSKNSCVVATTNIYKTGLTEKIKTSKLFKIYYKRQTGASDISYVRILFRQKFLMNSISYEKYIFILEYFFFAQNRMLLNTRVYISTALSGSLCSFFLSLSPSRGQNSIEKPFRTAFAFACKTNNFNCARMVLSLRMTGDLLCAVQSNPD